MTLEVFARDHSLPPIWLELRRRCEDMVRQPNFWYSSDLRQKASDLALQASNILYSTLRKTALKRDRLEAMTGDGGIHECSYAQNCVRICPKRMPLTQSISNVYGQVMKQTVADLLRK